MKISMLIVVLAILVVFFIVVPVGAIAPSLSPPVCAPTFAAPALGVSCGNMDDPCINRCCSVSPIDGIRVVDIPIISDVVNAMGIKQPLDPFNTLVYQTQSMMQPCVAGGVPTTPGDLANPACVCVTPIGVPLDSLTKMCDNITNPLEIIKCRQCMTGGNVLTAVGVWSGVGCVYANAGTFIQETLLGWGIGLAGGISMLCIIYAAIMMQTSGGNTEKVKKAQQLMTSCITGLMIIIFSVLILQLIGVRILKIPRFG